SLSKEATQASNERVRGAPARLRFRYSFLEGLPALVRRGSYTRMTFGSFAARFNSCALRSNSHALIASRAKVSSRYRNDGLLNTPTAATRAASAFSTNFLESGARIYGHPPASFSLPLGRGSAATVPRVRCNAMLGATQRPFEKRS